MKEKPLLTWDYSERLRSEVEYQLETWQDFDCTGRERPSESDLYDDINGDGIFAEEEWNEFLAQLDAILEERNPEGYWNMEVKNFGWRNISGSKIFYADNAKDFLASFLPNTDCIFNIFEYKKNGLKIQNFHHDSPTENEWYYAEPRNGKD